MYPTPFFPGPSPEATGSRTATNTVDRKLDNGNKDDVERGPSTDEVQGEPRLGRSGNLVLTFVVSGPGGSNSETLERKSEAQRKCRGKDSNSNRKNCSRSCRIEVDWQEQRRSGMQYAVAWRKREEERRERGPMGKGGRARAEAGSSSAPSRRRAVGKGLAEARAAEPVPMRQGATGSAKISCWLVRT